MFAWLISESIVELFQNSFVASVLVMFVFIIVAFVYPQSTVQSLATVECIVMVDRTEILGFGDV